MNKLIYRIHFIPSPNLTGTCVGSIIQINDTDTLYKVVATMPGPSYTYNKDKDQTIINLTPEILETFPEDEQKQFGDLMKITIQSKLVNPTVRNVNYDYGVIQYDTTKEQFYKFFSLE